MSAWVGACFYVRENDYIAIYFAKVSLALAYIC